MNADDEQAIRDLVGNWLAASNSGDHDTVLRLMAEDVVFLQPGQAPMRGRAAFAAAQRGSPERRFKRMPTSAKYASRATSPIAGITCP